ncbi:hypothetical protein EYF80_044471 [Liparis tanakae]|uniref:Uncharacterized protein n=1 Tax=Liparis tanakae TaxID=230148 RepID=A0A4Z2FWP9_9TELE|nr:hypothetical protein EYF80_044471 [Liparis tanakae]
MRRCAVQRLVERCETASVELNGLQQMGSLSSAMGTMTTQPVRHIIIAPPEDRATVSPIQMACNGTAERPPGAEWADDPGREPGAAP